MSTGTLRPRIGDSSNLRRSLGASSMMVVKWFFHEICGTQVGRTTCSPSRPPCLWINKSKFQPAVVTTCVGFLPIQTANPKVLLCLDNKHETPATSRSRIHLSYNNVGMVTSRSTKYNITWHPAPRASGPHPRPLPRARPRPLATIRGLNPPLTPPLPK